MNEFINLTSKAELPKDRNAWYDSTCKTMVYCHVTEADLPYLILFNLLRVLSGMECCFSFYKRDSHDNIEVNEEKGKQKKRCLTPSHKIKEIKQQDKDLGTGLGRVLDGLLYSDYRNAFAHSQYSIDKIGTLIFTGSLTGRAPETMASIPKSLDLLMPNDIDALYRAANTYLQTFIECYREAITPFRDGEFHKHELSGDPLMWDTECQQWTYHALV
jgi:hypothetical protein